ncbi:MAG TPA: TylF/MycF/NovP-related O-methyltransferase [Anaerolineales bacterium]|nr:TylF/MycF/NovP-related O-methyltransferase [Anaerolineales bacterium]
MLANTAIRLFDKLGYAIRKKSYFPTYPYELEKDAQDAVSAVRAHTMVSLEGLATLYDQAVFCETRHISGDFVECGTWRGGAVGLMAIANLKHGASRRHIHLFDSFEGLPEPDAAVDGEHAVQHARAAGAGVSGRLVPIGAEAFIGSLEENRDLLEKQIGYDPHCLHYHKGWFQETLPVAAKTIDRIAILRIDADWYASTKVCLEHLYDKVVSGGFVIIDDYLSFEGCKKAVDEFMEAQKITAYLNHIDQHRRYWIKPSI